MHPSSRPSSTRRRFKTVYEPRHTLHPFGPKQDALPGGFFSVIPALIKAKDEDIIRHNGLDAYLFVRFNKLMIVFFIPVAILTWAVVRCSESAFRPFPKQTLTSTFFSPSDFAALASLWNQYRRTGRCQSFHLWKCRQRPATASYCPSYPGMDHDPVPPLPDLPRMEGICD